MILFVKLANANTAIALTHHFTIFIVGNEEKKVLHETWEVAVSLYLKEWWEHCRPGPHTLGFAHSTHQSSEKIKRIIFVCWFLEVRRIYFSQQIHTKTFRTRACQKKNVRECLRKFEKLNKRTFENIINYLACARCWSTQDEPIRTIVEHNASKATINTNQFVELQNKVSALTGYWSAADPEELRWLVGV